MQRHRAVIWILIAPDFFWKVTLLHSCTPIVLFLFFTPFLSPRQRRHCDWQWCSVAVMPQPRLLLLLLPRCSTPRFPADSTTIPLFTVFFIFLVFTHWRMVLMWDALAPFSVAWEPRGLSASSHPGVSVGSPLKLGTQSSPPWSESLATATHNPYSKDQLDWDHGAQGEQRDLLPPPTSHFPVTEYLGKLGNVKIETLLKSPSLRNSSLVEIRAF